HENEIAQTEGAFGGTLASIWMHCGPLMVDADKMSKSLGNFRRIRSTIAAEGEPAEDVAEYTPNPREAEMLRFFIVRNHYRSVQNYTPDNLVDAQHALDRLYQALANVPPQDVEINWEAEYCREFRDAMNDDFNSAGAVAVLFELASEANRSQSPQVSGLLKALGNVLGLLQSDPQTYLRAPSRYLSQAGKQGAQLGDDEIEALIEARTAAKKARDFAQADSIRDRLQEAGIELEDRPGGVTQWRRA